VLQRAGEDDVRSLDWLWEVGGWEEWWRFWDRVFRISLHVVSRTSVQILGRDGDKRLLNENPKPSFDSCILDAGLRINHVGRAVIHYSLFSFFFKSCYAELKGKTHTSVSYISILSALSPTAKWPKRTLEKVLL
jgi:hypothetical protein